MLEEDNSFTQITQATEGYILAFRSSIIVTPFIIVYNVGLYAYIIRDEYRMQ